MAMSKTDDLSTVPAKFVTEPSTSLKCPLCSGLFRDPVISTRCGHTFCRACVSQSGSAMCCPIDDVMFETSHLVVNRAVLGQLDDLLVYCRHGLIRYDSEEDFTFDKTGCSEQIPYSKRDDHESMCLYAVLPCPNSSNHCGKFRRRDLEEHMRVCAHVPCPYKAKGCVFYGTTDEVNQHLPSCVHTSTAIEWDILATAKDDDALNGLYGRYVMKAVKNLNDRVGNLERSKETIIQQFENCNSNVTNLTAQVERLTQAVEQLRFTQLALMRDRIGSQSASDVTTFDYSALYPRSFSSTGLNVFTNRSRSSSGGSPVMPWSTPKYESWKMPFTFKCMGTFSGHSGTIWSSAAKGNHLFSAGADCLIKVWDIADIKNSKGCIQTLKGHKDDIHALCASGTYLYSAGSDKSICMWNLNGYIIEKIEEGAHDDIICALLSTGSFLLSSSHSIIKCWKLGSLELIHTIENLHHWVRALVMDERKEKVFSGSHNTLHVWDANTFSLRGKLDHTHGSIYSLAVTKKYLILGTYNQNVQLYDANSFQHIKTLAGHIGTVTGLMTSLSGSFLFTCSCDCTIQIWDLVKLLPIQVLTRHEASVNCLTLKGDVLYSGSEDREIKVFVYKRSFNTSLA